jgi:hypothetical protein
MADVGREGSKVCSKEERSIEMTVIDRMIQGGIRGN